MRLLLAFAAILGAAAQAQDQPRPEITGTVLELGTNFGLSGAQVDLLRDQKSDPDTTTSTDSQGKFTLHPADFGNYVVRVQLTGYEAATFMGSRLGGLDNYHGTVATVSLRKGYPKEDLRFVLLRPAELTGHVVDAETEKPLAKVSVAWVSKGGFGLRQVVSHGRPVKTDANGDFAIPEIAPGDYAVEVLPELTGNAQLQTQFAATDAGVIDQDLERSVWPGGRDLDSAAMVAVTSGQSISVGTIRVRRVPYYRVRVDLDRANCPEGEKTQVRFGLPGPVPNMVDGEVPCGAPFLIRGVPSGSYQLQLAVGRAESLAQAIVPVEVGDRNTGVTAILQRGLDVDGKVVFADGTGSPPEPQAFTIAAFSETPLAANPPFNPDSQWRFHLANLPQGKYDIELLNSAGGFFLAGLRYNGHAQPGTSVALEPGAPLQSLEIVLDDKPASITGLVQDGDRPVSKALIIAKQWPLTADASIFRPAIASAGDDGKFRLTGLTPGDYRIAAVAADAQDKLNEPGVLERVLTQGQQVTLDRGGTQDVELKVVNPH